MVLNNHHGEGELPPRSSPRVEKFLLFISKLASFLK